MYGGGACVVGQGADGLVVWGSLWEPGTAAHPNAQWGPYGKDSAYMDYVRTQTGPMIQRFRAVAADCATQKCSGHGRCRTVPLNQRLVNDQVDRTPSSPSDTFCLCFDGFTGHKCDAKPAVTTAAVSAVTA